MKRKISTTLAATLIASQMQSVAFAKDINSIQEANVINEDTSHEMNNINKDIVKETEKNELEENSTIEKEEVIKTEKESTVAVKDNYTPTGKLELDLNFSMPIRVTDMNTTNISVELTNEDGVTETVKLGSDNTSGELNSNIKYTLEALDHKRSKLEDGAENLDFYHLTFNNLPLGIYSLKIKGAGYDTANVDGIEILKSSKRILMGTSEKKIAIDNKGTKDASDDITEVYPGVFLAGNINDEAAVNELDYEALKNEIKSSSVEAKVGSNFDLNRDGQVDITDLTYVHQNMNKEKKEAIIQDTDVIINPENVSIEVADTVEVKGADIKDILKDNGNTVTFETKDGVALSKDNPISVPIDLTGSATYSSGEGGKVEKVVIKAPSETAPGTGNVVIPKAGESGQDIVVEFNEKNSTRTKYRTADGQAIDEIVIDLGKQVAVSQITLNVTSGRNNKNLAEIAQVDFLNNVYSEMPKPKMNIPVISKFTSATAVGNEHMYLEWEHQPNVTGYEIKVEEVKANGKVSYYKTSENSFKIEKVDPYGIYRISIQSLSGDEWKSGYKDEQDDYIADAKGSTNLTNNSNDKDGIPDNVDKNYNPQGWDSKSGILSDSAAEGVENANAYGADSIIEVQVVPETAPEGPEGVKITGKYKSLEVSWKAHKKAKDYDLYYRKVGSGAWIKANDNNKDYVDTDPNNDIPDGVKDLSPEEKKDHDELIRGTSYRINGLEDKATYEIMMTATNHHGTGGLSKTYIGSTEGINPPKMTNYKLINKPTEGEIPSSHIVDIEYGRVDPTEHPNGMENKYAIVDNDHTTYWTSFTWNSSHSSGPLVTFDKEYTMDTIRIVTRLDGGYAVGDVFDYVPVRYFDSGKNEFVNVNATYIQKVDNGSKYYEVKLPEPVTTSKIQTALRINPSYGNVARSSISEIKFYEYDSLENDVDNLFADDLMLELKEDVTQERIDELRTRANTIDSGSMEYHPNREILLENIERAQNLYEDVNIKDRIVSLDSQIRNQGNTIGQSNNWQALGVAARPGDEVTIYVGSNRKDTTFNLGVTQHYGESGTYMIANNIPLKVGKNVITIPESPFDMNYEKGGNLYINFASNYNEVQDVRVRVSGGTEIPHLNLNNMIDDASKEIEVKDAIRTYIRELKTYVGTLPDRYPETVTSEDKANNIYSYDPETSILNSTEIEGERITLSLAANQVLNGIESGIVGNEEAQVNRVYDTLLAWEQLMKVSYAQQGLLENPIDFDGNGIIDNTPQEKLGGKGESTYFNENRAPRNRINIKYQRMFTGAFMYASGHHVGIGYGSVPGMMTGVPFKFDDNGNLLNPEEGNLFGWGINHEIGHVHDRDGLTYAETTNNILALISQTFNDTSESRVEPVMDKAYKKVTSGSEGLASDGLARLAMFWQLHLAYDDDNTYKMLEINNYEDLENDTIYAKLYREARYKKAADSEVGHDRTAQTFIMRASDAAGKDLREFFKKWGLVASPKTNAYLDSKNYPKETRAIYYLNDYARRRRIDAIQNNDMSRVTMNEGTKVNATFGTDKKGNEIGNGSYLNQKEVPLSLGVNQDSDKILGYEIIRTIETTDGVETTESGFVERDRENDITEYVDVLDTLNNRTIGYKVKAYDYNLNVTSITEIGTVKVTHDGSIAKDEWKFDTNTRSNDDVSNENTGHGQVQSGSINNIKDNDSSTVYNGSKTTDMNGNIVNGNPYVTVDMGRNKQVVGLKYTPAKSQAKKFSLKNLFKKGDETTYEPISNYEVHVSKDGKNWTKAHSGKFDITKENTIYFNEAGSSDNSQLWSYDAQYVRLTSTTRGVDTISIAELDILGPQGDNIEIGSDNGDQVYRNGVGRLKTSYEYAEGKSIPAGSIIVTGEYKGDPAFNVPLIINENGGNFALQAQAVLLANLPENSELGEVAEGTWIYWITPEQQGTISGGEFDGENNIEGTLIKAELKRFNKLDAQGRPVGERLVSDTFYVELPTDLKDLPSIDLKGGTGRTLGSSYDKVFEIDSNMMGHMIKNR
ncbi:M60 family metallopeptidase [Clostridium sp. LP20]|uniref:M60 family metallopeptidase n=1 Tax=Clostridium sp. LP20 TaxID=3418665 RepID=UPI003EE4EB0C